MANDDSSIEGAITRNLFRTDSDTDDDDDNDKNVSNSPGDHAITNISCCIVERQVMDVLLAEQQFGGSIAQRLWPAAQYLAEFVLNSTQKHEHQTKSDGSIETKQATDMAAILNNLLCTRNKEKPLHVIELGAGVGLTGLQLATMLPCRILSTDLDEAIPLLEQNIKLNKKRFQCGEDAVQTQVLAWGDESHCQEALSWLPKDDQLLILAADCVYFKELQDPLEQTLASLLSHAPEGSIGLIAGARRWKSDNAFYAKLGERSKTAHHYLSCVCLQETVTRDLDGHRDVLRVYGIQWRNRHDA